MHCDYRAMPKYLMDHNLALGPHYGAMGGPKMVRKSTSLFMVPEPSNFQGLLFYDVVSH